jgi:hypothetical protein
MHALIQGLSTQYRQASLTFNLSLHLLGNFHTFIDPSPAFVPALMTLGASTRIVYSIHILGIQAQIPCTRLDPQLRAVYTPETGCAPNAGPGFHAEQKRA